MSNIQKKFTPKDAYEISSYFVQYPEIENNKYFNSYISRKIEFSELKSDIKEAPPKIGEYYNHQIFAARYMITYDRLFVVDDPGTGKSCLLTLIAEFLKEEFMKNESDPTKIREAIILTRGPTLVYSLKEQIACKCTNHIYDNTPAIKNANNEKSLKTALTNSLKRFYQVMTYGTFHKKLSSFIRDEDKDKYMSNISIFCDEAHNMIRIKDVSTKGKKNIDLDENKDRGEEYDEEEEDDDEGEIAESESGEEGILKDSYTSKYEEIVPEKNTIYGVFHDAFHRGKRNKIILLSGTPMINKTKEFPLLMNLILPLNVTNSNDPKQVLPNYGQPGQLDWKDKTEDDINNIKFEELEPYLRGRIFYTRALDTGTSREYQANLEVHTGIFREHYTKLYIVRMSTYQYSIYLQSEKEEREKRQGDNKSTGSLFYDNQRKISNLVYPNGGFGWRGYGKNNHGAHDYMMIKKGNYEYTEIGLSNLKPLYRNDDSLRELSGKGEHLIRIAREAYPDILLNKPDPEKYYDQIGTDKGIIFIYVPDFVFGSGAADFERIFSENGYKLFNFTNSIFSGGIGITGLSVCPNSISSGGDRQSKIPVDRRVALMHSKTSPSQVKAIFDTINSRENRYGQYLQVLISSKVGQEGININNAIAMIMLSPTWNYARRRQAEDRIFRATSHIERINDFVEKLKSEGKTQEEIEETPFPVKVYNMAAAYIGEELPPIDDTEPFKNIYNYIQNNPIIWSDRDLMGIYMDNEGLIPDDEDYKKIVNWNKFNENQQQLPFLKKSKEYSLINEYIQKHVPNELNDNDIKFIMVSYPQTIPNKIFEELLDNDEDLPELGNDKSFDKLRNFIKIRQWDTEKLMSLYARYPDLLPNDESYIEKYKQLFENPSLIYDNFNTTDIDRYFLIEKKDKNIRKIMRYLKMASVPCYTNRIRNISMRKTDLDGSPVCDYTNCVYECSGINDEIMKTEDWSTKILLYYKDEVDAAILEIKEIFNVDTSLTIDQIISKIKEKIPNIQDIFILMAIDEMISRNIRILNRFGYSTYLRNSESGIIYLESDKYGYQIHPDNAYYNNILLSTNNPKNNTFEEYISSLEVYDEKYIIENMRDMNPDSNEFRNNVDKLSLETKVKMIEDIIVKSETQALTKSEEVILSMFDDFIFVLREPLNQIAYTADKLSRRGQTRGRKPTSEEINTKNWEFPEFDFENGEKVYVHRLYSEKIPFSSHGRSSKFFNVNEKLRIYKPIEKSGFRDTNNIENIVYKHYIKTILRQVYEHYTDFKIFGIKIPPKNEFQIVDLSNIDISDTSDIRNIPKGKECVNWSEGNLIEVMYKLMTYGHYDLWPRGFNQQDYSKIASFNRETLINNLNTRKITASNFEHEKLIFYTAWLQQPNKSISDYCSIIEQSLSNKNKIFIGEIPKNLKIINGSPEISDLS